MFSNLQSLGCQQFSCAKKNAPNIGFSSREIQEPYPTISNNREKQLPLALVACASHCHIFLKSKNKRFYRIFANFTAHKCVRYQDFFFTESKLTDHQISCAKEKASNIDCSLREIQEPYPTINNPYRY